MERDEMGAKGRSRREALRRMGLGGAGLVLAARGGWPTFAAAQEDVEPLPFTDIPEDFSLTRRGVPYRIDLRELRSWITPNEEFFSVAHYDRPAIDASRWSLRVGGLVDRPLRLDLDEIEALPRVEKTVGFECSGNRATRHHGLVGNATWTGTPLRALLEKAGPRDEAIEVVFWAADRGTEKIRGEEYEQNFARALSLDDAMTSEAILAYGMNGRPLPPKNGYPLRLVVPGWYGIAQVKWLERIELVDRRLMNRFMARDYVTIIGREVEGGIEWIERSVTRQRVKSVVARVGRRPDGRIVVFGAAWSDGTPLETVEVRVDDGAWRPARLDDRGNPFSWTFFTAELPALGPGEHRVVSRATDRKGRVQPESLPLKKTYWEDNAQWVRTFRV